MSSIRTVIRPWHLLIASVVGGYLAWSILVPIIMHKPALVVDDRGDLAIDAEFFKENELFGLGLLGARFDGEMIVNEAGLATGLTGASRSDLSGVKRDLDLLGYYLLRSVIDRKSTTRRITTLGPLAGSSGTSKGKRRGKSWYCRGLLWRGMKFNGCGYYDTDEPRVVKDPEMTVSWRDNTYGFLVLDEFKALTTEICESERYIIVKGECPRTEGPFDVSLDARANDNRWARLRFSSKDGRSEMLLAPALRVGTEDLSRVSIAIQERTDAGLRSRTLEGDELRALIERMR
ncbi:MAG: hypothetical protein AAGC79_17360 [Pseudomonadota bacterium]